VDRKLSRWISKYKIELLDGVFTHKRAQQFRFLCERNEKVSHQVLSLHSHLPTHPPTQFYIYLSTYSIFYPLFTNLIFSSNFQLKTSGKSLKTTKILLKYRVSHNKWRKSKQTLFLNPLRYKQDFLNEYSHMIEIYAYKRI
jgi:hypothetical protein